MKKVQPIRSLKTVKAIKGNLKKRSARNFLLFTLGINTGLRISDLRKLKLEDVQDETGEVREFLDLNEVKTKRQHLIFLTTEAKRALRYFIDKTGMYDLDQYLFTSNKTKKNKPLTRVRCWQMINEWCREAGLRGRVGTHTLRKTAGYQMRMAGIDLLLISHILGHKNLSTTKLYLGIRDDEVHNALRNFNL